MAITFYHKWQALESSSNTSVSFMIPNSSWPLATSFLWYFFLSFLLVKLTELYMSLLTFSSACNASLNSTVPKTYAINNHNTFTMDSLLDAPLVTMVMWRRTNSALRSLRWLSRSTLDFLCPSWTLILAISACLGASLWLRCVYLSETLMVYRCLVIGSVNWF